MDASPDSPDSPQQPLYHRIAHQIELAIASGALGAGARLPSVRQLSQQHGVSIATALQALRHLEDQGVVQARPKSGYFVMPRVPALPEPQVDLRVDAASFVSMDQVLHEFLLTMEDPQAMPAFQAAPSRALLPEAKLQAILASVNRRHPEYATEYHMGSSLALRQQIARRAMNSGVQLRPEEIVITNGGMEAMYLALKSVAGPGDTVAVESPTYFNLLQSIESLGIRAIEIPSHPRVGISLEALDFATQPPQGRSQGGAPPRGDGREATSGAQASGAVKACVLLPHFPNPGGSMMPVEHKRQLVQLCAERGITLIESDIYGELYFGDQRPPVCKSFDQHNDVILCSAFTKTVAPGYRIGWVAPGKHFLKTQTLKTRTSVACPMLQQEVLAQFMRDGGYDHHLRKLRASLKHQAHQMAEAVARYFPMGCRLSLPEGGLMLWIELPRHVDSRAVFALARLEHIGVAPGAAFSIGRRFDHFIRLQYGQPWSPRMEAAIKRLGEIIKRLAESPANASPLELPETLRA